jgi:hypothetical protein
MRKALAKDDQCSVLELARSNESPIVGQHAQRSLSIEQSKNG